MRTLLKKWFLIPVVASLLVAIGCSGGQGATPTAAQTLTDQLGRTVAVPKTAQRIISMSPANTEILYALGLGDRVVAVTDFDDYPPEVKNKPSIGGFSTPDFEKIISLSPDLVIASNLQWKDIISGLEENFCRCGAHTRVIDAVQTAAATMKGGAQ